MTQRRLFLRAGAATALAPFMSRLVQAATPRADAQAPVLVVVFQRFGMDGLMAVTPYADAGLAALRPRLMLPRPGSGDSDALRDLDGRFGLHPALAPLLPLYREGRLAVVHGVGSPHHTRSHLEAQQYWENGVPGDKFRADGWLNRALPAQTTGWPAVALTPELPRICYGARPVAALGDLTLLRTPSALAQQLGEVYGSSPLQAQAEQVLAVQRHLAQAPANVAPYPAGSPLGRSLADAAQLIRAGLGLRVVFVESRTDALGTGSWDSHSNQRAEGSPFWRMADDLARSVSAFWSDLGPAQDRVSLVTLTDFGRNVVENDGQGTDHGRATAMFVLGHAVQGGRVRAVLPERFERDALEDRMDLPVGIDYRAVLAPLVQHSLGVRDTAAVFPGWSGASLPLIAA